MAILIRRSNLMVPVTHSEMLDQSWRSNADAITLDLEGGIVSARKSEARGLVKSAVATAAKGAAEIFVRVNKSTLQADLEAAIWPGVRGIMLPRVESAREVVDTAAMVSVLEQQRGIAAGTLQLIVLLESAIGVWNVRTIITASTRISQVGLVESSLAADLGVNPLPEFDPFEIARGRVTIEATAAKVNPIGMAYPLSVAPRLLPEAEIHKLATKARNLGMKGVICPHESWVAPVNAAFTPTAELVAYNKRVREAFAAGVAAGTAAVPLDGRMIDVPVDEWAIVVIATAEACAARDAEKSAALGG